MPVQLRNLRLTGIGVGSRADFLSLLRLMETHQMRPVIDQRFPFSKAREAFAAFLSPRGIGKIVIEQTD